MHHGCVLSIGHACWLQAGIGWHCLLRSMSKVGDFTPLCANSSVRYLNFVEHKMHACFRHSIRVFGQREQPVIEFTGFQGRPLVLSRFVLFGRCGPL